MNPLILFNCTALVLLSFGIVGFVRRRSLVGMLIAVELMLNGAGLSIVAAGQLTPAPAPLAQLSGLLVMGLAAAEATLALAIILVVAKRFGKADAADVAELEG